MAGQVLILGSRTDTHRRGHNTLQYHRLLVVLALALTIAGCGRSDASLQSNLQAQIAADAAMLGARVNVEVRDQVAYLSGETESKTQQLRAAEIARAIKGINDVATDMKLSDPAVAAAVKNAVASDAAVSRVPLTVEASGGHVRLISDQTNAEERARIVQIARNVEGVVTIEDAMR